MKKYPFTTNGFKQLKDELVQLKEKRKAVSKAIGEARELGDLKENAEYHAAKEEQRLNEERINLLERYHSQAEIIDTLKLKDDGAVVFGSFVEVVDLDNETTISFQIVGEYEANISKGLLSISSPIARAILRKEEGDIALVETPNGQKEYEVTKISLHPLNA
ncbi:MAG: transcription elongation factor GreA [Legionellales bacterium]|jgi:transcription elongation factor GreA|nr:transcription elongation factor GreA [Legionellales bacterium]OUX64630.1 MAG: transcription elongation factor GreA [Gammaproteobacteria bacterium TMED281]